MPQDNNDDIVSLPPGYRALAGWGDGQPGPRVSPNFGPRRDDATPSLIVIHYTAMTSAYAACNVLCDPEAQVSAHYLVDETGHILNLVPETMRAWHAGAGQWGAVTDVNSHSIGIELANDGDSPFAAAQMDALTDLLHGIMGRWNIAPQGIIGHSDMAPGRKIDPGVRFDWRRFALEGVAVWPEDPMKTRLADFVSNMQRFGYTSTDDPDLLLKVFRMRFRPHAIGPLDHVDAGLIADLARRFPVDANTA